MIVFILRCIVSKGLSQIYIKTNQYDQIIIIATTVTKNSSRLYPDNVFQRISLPVKRKKMIFDDTNQFNGCDIQLGNKVKIQMDMTAFK